MGWKLLAAASLALLALSALVYWLGAGSSYSTYLGKVAGALAKSPGGDALAIAWNRELRLYDSAGSLRWSKTLDEDVCAASFSPGGGKVAVFAGDRLYFISVADGSVIKEVAMPLSCAPSSFIYWSPSGGAVLLNARGRVAYVTLAGRGEVSPYVGLTVTRVSWVSDVEALIIDDYGKAVYSFSVPPLTVNLVASYGKSGSASIFGDRVFIISSKGWAALVGFGGTAYNISLGSQVRASAVAGLGFAVVGDEALAIDPGTGDVVWKHTVIGGEGALLRLRACGDAVAVTSAVITGKGGVRYTQILIDGEDVLEGLLPENGTDFLAWFPGCSSALVYSGGATYIVDVEGRRVSKTEWLLFPEAAVGDYLVVTKVTDVTDKRVIGEPYLLSKDGSMKPLVKLVYTYSTPLNNDTLVVIEAGGVWLVRVGAPPPSASWAWLTPAFAGAALAALAVRAFIKGKRGS